MNENYFNSNIYKESLEAFVNSNIEVYILSK